MTLDEQIDEVLAKIAALWTPGHDDSYRRNRYELHDQYVIELRALEAQRGEWCNYCVRCMDERDVADGRSWPRTMSVMVVCHHCGNKRCPHATDHRLDCTQSNEPGQPGSRYGGIPADHPQSRFTPLRPSN